MVKSSLRKDRTKIITTDKELGFVDVQTVVASETETGGVIYQIPRKAEVKFRHISWSFGLNQDPVDVAITFAVIGHPGDDATLDDNAEWITDAIVNRTQHWRILTAVGAAQVHGYLDQELNFDIIRKTNLSLDEDYAIVPIYRTDATVVCSQTGIFIITEKLTQEMFRDDPTEWAGYTFEESAS